MTYVLGINAFHGDASACLLRDGRLLAAAEEERFRRLKHWAGFPREAIRYCLDSAGIELRQVGIAAINQDSRAHLGRKLAFSLAHRPDPRYIVQKLRTRRRRESLQHLLEGAFPGAGFRGEVVAIEHHRAHLASAFYASPFERAVVVSVDGMGDFASAAWGIGTGADLTIDGRVYFPHSLGIFYQALTQFLGFPHYGDEYKVMGLAPYGRPALLDRMREIVTLRRDGAYRLNLAYFRHHRENVSFQWDEGAPTCDSLFSPELLRLLGPPRAPADPLEQRHFDIARSVQGMYEEALFHLLNTLHARYGVPGLALAGGCAANSVANGRIPLRTPFREVYVQPAAGDAGGAIGAAFAACQASRRNGSERAGMSHAFWGPEFSDDAIGAVLEGERERLEAAGVTVRRVDDESVLCAATAAAIADGGVVGWFQGRMEWGPRALGNRSILGDPRRADMKDILNRKIKRRESFRPFAPSVLRSAVGEWFEQDADVPFMAQVFQVREHQRPRIPAVTHVDGSGRLQSVCEAANPRYHRLISDFAAITGVPMLLNTSFNENEPVVCRPEEALACFLRTRMDLLVMGNWLVARAVPPRPAESLTGAPTPPC